MWPRSRVESSAATASGRWRRRCGYSQRMRVAFLLPVVLTLVACNKGGGVSAPTIASKVTAIRGLTPTKTIPSSTGGGDMLRYELKQPLDAVVASVRKDAQAGGWKEMSPMGHPVFVATSPKSIANVDVESGKLSADGLTLSPDAGTTVVTVTETSTAGAKP